MTDIAALLRRLEEATEGSRELDWAIAKIAEPWTRRVVRWEPEGITEDGENAHPESIRFWVEGRERGYTTWLPPWSTSIDAAMTLVPERGDEDLLWRVFIERKPLHSGPPWFVTIREHAKDGASAVAYTAPLAICAAALQLRSGDCPS